MPGPKPRPKPISKKQRPISISKPELKNEHDIRVWNHVAEHSRSGAGFTIDARGASRDVLKAAINLARQRGHKILPAKDVKDVYFFHPK